MTRGQPSLKTIASVIALSLAVLAAPLAADAQQAAKVPRIGILPPGPISERQHLWETFRQGLRELGYVEGKNITLVFPSAEVTPERVPHLAAELVRLKVDVIVAGTTPAALAAKQATKTIPIVAATMADPVGDGLVASLARPGGNITGSTFLGPELVPKRLELLKDAIPGTSRVAALWHPGAYSEPTMRDMLKEIETAARALAVQLQLVRVRGPADFDRAFSAMTTERAGALIVLPSPMLYSERKRIVDLAAKHRLPAIYAWREPVEGGGLMSYGASIPDLYRRAATHVDKILKGAKPADLPVEQPTKFELVINLKTAKALGLTIPPSLLGRADELIE